jgi:hypothetical protein
MEAPAPLHLTSADVRFNGDGGLFLARAAL